MIVEGASTASVTVPIVYPLLSRFSKYYIKNIFLKNDIVFRETSDGLIIVVTIPA